MMGCLVQVVSLAFLVSNTLCQSKDGFTDENRPYEFGFTIDGEQHRYEKKDEKGIIMGEFGFITADGIYHVTVYATDENGNFKILKIKNIKVGFPPGKTTTTTPKPSSKNLQLTGLMGCSGCLIPDTSSPRSIPANKPPSRGISVQAETNSENYPKFDPRVQSGSFQPITPENRLGINDFSKTETGKYNFGEGTPKFKQTTDQYLTPATGVIKPNAIPDQVYVKPLKSEKQPQLNAVEMKLLDYMARLYKFNYTLSFHGHEETGDVGGNKNGSFFSNGRDGYQRKVVYTANEFGYQPKVTLVKLDADSTPNEQTEKEKTVLKGSEFIWFYNKKQIGKSK